MGVYVEAQHNQLVTEFDIQSQAELEDHQVQLADVDNPTQAQDNLVIGGDGVVIPHWNESVDFDTWVKIHIENAGRRVLMIHGNDGLIGVSSIDDTMIFGDDFSDDLSKWEGNTSIAAISDGILTITGTGKYLKEKNKDIKIIGIEPTTSEHKLPGMKRITGLPKDLVPKILDKSIIDDSTEVSDENAYKTAIELARKEGILVGPTTGAILYAALKYAKKNKGITVVISPDGAFKYASFYKTFLGEKTEATKIKEHDLRDYHCPLSKVKTMEILQDMKTGDSAKIILGDPESLKNVAQELKLRGLKPDFEKENDSFLLTITK